MSDLAHLKLVERRPRWVWVVEVVCTAVFVAVAVSGWILMYVRLADITTSTNDAVRKEVPGLQKQIADRDATIAQDQDIQKQLTDAVILQSKKLTDHGIDPGTITIRPNNTTTTTAPGH